MALKESQIIGIGVFLSSIGGLIVSYSLLKDINSVANAFFAGIFIITGMILIFNTRMTRKKLFYALGIIAAVVILVEGVLFLIDGQLWRPIWVYNTDEVTRPITVFQSGGSSLLIAECGDKDYISNKSDYILEGTVGKVWSKWVDMKTRIHTYTDLAIDNYVKGTPFAEKEMTIITEGGCVGNTCQAVEDQPVFHEGKNVRIYFKESSGEFSIVCGEIGVEEIDGIDLNDKSINTSSSFPFFPTQNGPATSQMQALLEGELTLVNGCLRVADNNPDTDNYLLVWPYGFSLSTEGAVIRIIDSTGQLIAQAGDEIKFGGGADETPDGDVAKYYSAQLPSNRCSGPYWIVGEIMTN